MIEHIEIRDFTVFDELKTDFVPGVNVFIGANGTGKTHLLKLLYSIQGTRSGKDFFQSISEKILKAFLPHDLSFKRLIHRGKRGKKTFYISIAKNTQKMSFEIDGDGIHTEAGIEYFESEKAVYIPVKEMLANAPGFRSLYKEREVHFEEVYLDIIDKAFLPPLKNLRPDQEAILKILQKELGGKIQLRKEEFFLRQNSSDIEFTLVAEGIRKIALLWLLVSNGALDKGATLYWDEPETNLNPAMLQIVVKVLLLLEQMGVQMFIATHSYELLKEFELQQKEHSLCFYSLFKDKGTININTAMTYHQLDPNKIGEAFSRIYDLEIERSIKGK